MISRSTAVILSALAMVFLATPATALDAVNRKDNLAVHGYDPVAYFERGAPLRGSEEFGHTWQEARWLFASAGPSYSDDSNPVFEYPGIQATQWDTPGRFSVPGYNGTFRYMRYHPSNGLLSIGDILMASDWKPSY